MSDRRPVSPPLALRLDAEEERRQAWRSKALRLGWDPVELDVIDYHTAGHFETVETVSESAANIQPRAGAMYFWRRGSVAKWAAEAKVERARSGAPAGWNTGPVRPWAPCHGHALRADCYVCVRVIATAPDPEAEAARRRAEETRRAAVETTAPPAPKARSKAEAAREVRRHNLTLPLTAGPADPSRS